MILPPEHCIHRGAQRLDLDRSVPREVVLECLELAVQAPTRGNSQGWRWIVVDDPAQRAGLAELYRKAARDYLAQAGAAAAERGDTQTERVYGSAVWLTDNLEKVPVHVIPCIEGRPPVNAPAAMLAGTYGSISRRYGASSSPCGPAVWVRRSRRCTLSTNRRPPGCSDSRTISCRSPCCRSATPRVRTSSAAARPPVASVTHWNRW